MFNDNDYGIGLVIALIVLGIILAIGSIFLVPLLIMLLWNWVAVAIFGAVTLTYWQAFGLWLLISLLFNGIRTVIKINKD